MDVYCASCGEPWEMDTVHDEVTKRYPNKPWYVEEKPQPSKEPDTIEKWCDYRADDFFCAQYENAPVHTTDMPNKHTFHPHVSTNYKTWNYSSFVDKNTGLWFNDLIYSQHYEPIRAEFQRLGCAAFGLPHNNTKANPALALIYDMMGDDMDAAATFIEDYNLGESQ